MSSAGGADALTCLDQLQAPAASTLVDCGIYLDGQRLSGQFTPAAARDRVRELGDGFVWVGLHEPDERQMHDVAKVFGLHPLAVEDAVHAHQRPKLERYDDTLLLVLKTVQYIPHESVTLANEIVETGEIMIFVAAHFVVTVRHGDFSGLADLRKELEAAPDRLRRGPFAVMHAIADHVVDSYVEVTSLVETDIDTVEVETFSPRRTTEIEHIYLLKREVVELRRAVSPLSVALQRILTDHKDLIASKEISRYLRDVIDHQTMAAERIDNFDEVLSSLVQAAVARIGTQQNIDLRKISAWVAIASVVTMVAGIYGMNFDHMPELRQVWGYPAVLGVMAIACTALYRTFRRNHWL
ncbi:magnesium and cobalt transport protein CorA [Mycobacterium sp. PDNC021]|uniref:magnesium and cobalt transport protein CorA n=1 Tax=Mycobacterium sp. PDNC021 TaxID=3391399 RepID=UPI003AACC2A9